MLLPEKMWMVLGDIKEGVDCTPSAQYLPCELDMVHTAVCHVFSDWMYTAVQKKLLMSGDVPC